MNFRLEKATDRHQVSNSEKKVNLDHAKSHLVYEAEEMFRMFFLPISNCKNTRSKCVTKSITRSENENCSERCSNAQTVNAIVSFSDAMGFRIDSKEVMSMRGSALTLHLQ